MTPAAVTVYEVGPRDGLQNEPESVPTEAKLELLGRLVAAGLQRIEATSYVSPKWIPQLADADEVAARLPAGPVWSALVPNARGYERFRKSAIPVAAFFVSASETHNRKNVNRSIAEHIDAFRPVAERIRADGVRLRAYVSTVCGCPYEGAVAPPAVVDVVRCLVALEVDEISLGDTIGIGTPSQVRDLVRAVAGEVPLGHVALHLHDTYGRALANVMAGYAEGIRSFDSSLGGLGGCPYAPGASGNVATEDVVDLFAGEGIPTGVDLDALVDACTWLEDEVLHRPLPGRVYRARRGLRDRSRADMGDA
jgi:hydroxymethylglutaryl-CoA lyase